MCVDRWLFWLWSAETPLLPVRRRSSWPWVAGVGTTGRELTHTRWCRRCGCPSWPWRRCWTWCDRPASWAQTTCWMPLRPAPRAATWTSTTGECSVSALHPPPASSYYHCCGSNQTSNAKCNRVYFVLSVQYQRRTSPPWSTELRWWKGSWSQRCWTETPRTTTSTMASPDILLRRTAGRGSRSNWDSPSLSTTYASCCGTEIPGKTSLSHSAKKNLPQWDVNIIFGPCITHVGVVV